MDYNKTVHLPQTEFPMRAGLPKREPELLNGKWEVETYHKLKAQCEALRREYETACGPLTATGNHSISSWDWMSKPFPWEYDAD